MRINWAALLAIAMIAHPNEAIAGSKQKPGGRLALYLEEKRIARTYLKEKPAPRIRIKKDDK